MLTDVAPAMLSPPPVPDGRFRLIMPIEPTVLVKAKPKDENEHWIIEGIASTDDEDLQEEVVVQEGMDFEPLKQSGYLNWNHMEGPENIVGIPLVVKMVEGPKLYIKGELLQHVPRAQAIYHLALSLEQFNKDNPDGPHRRLAWSIEGAKLEQEGGYIKRCRVDQMAITHEPVNPFTWAQLVKSLRQARQVHKAMNTVADGALDNQNLDDGTLGIWGGCRAGHYDPATGRFKRGVAGAMEHLVLCRGLQPPDARKLLTRIKSAY